ncbi:phosphatase PAP2 family protein [Actinotalea sp. K2]|uniref:phosphatase PAP2 family protein n=1 Tax=Actinotalea sp. K2 TaxID=2939438 RepID=UPI002017BE30|nr:phosphatase PAP2 family protein [Actinotalea sp. K2]MCL3860352.1 phosphatase PAP2 family protein [Actinotalea sp. K2]
MSAARERIGELARSLGARDHRAQVSVLAGLGLVVLGTAGFVGVLDALGEGDDLARLDEPVLAWLVDARSEPLTVFLAAVSWLTGPVVLPVLVVLGCLAWGVRGRTWWPPGLLMAAMVAATVVSLTVKQVTARPRPPVDTLAVPGEALTHSFPSGHTIGTATLLLVVAYLAWVRRPAWRSLVLWSLVVALGVLLVAVSRLYLGYHFVTDVVASVALAVAVLGGVVVADRRRALRAARLTVG